jgi:hypothetical protein
MNTVIAQDHQIFDDIKSFLTDSSAPRSGYPICIKNSHTDHPHVLFNTEQLTRDELKSNSRKNFNLAIFENPNIIEIWDYSIENIKILKQNNITNCKHVPFSIWPAYREKILSYNSDNKYDHDVAFCGGLNSRRQKITAALVERGISVDIIENTYGEKRDARIAKSRMLLNVHFNDDYKIFEQLRCFAWLDTGKVIVSENSLDDDPRCRNSNYESLVPTVVESLAMFTSPNSSCI